MNMFTNTKNVGNLSNILAQKAAVEAQLKQLNERQIEIQKIAMQEVAAKLDALPKQFGVEKLSEVEALIRQRLRNTLGATRAPRTRIVIDDTTKAILVNRLAIGGPGNGRNDIMHETGVSYQTVQNWLKGAGMVKARTPVVATAPVQQRKAA